MKISKIYSTRNNNNAVYSDLIYEWEDIFSEYLKVPIYSYGKIKEKIIRRIIFKYLDDLKLSYFFQKVEKFRKPKSMTLVIELYPRTYFSFQVFSNKIPYIIDFDYNVSLNTFFSVYKNCKLILISSLEAYNYLKVNNCPLPIEHFPLSLSNKYELDVESCKSKKFDVIVTRSNKILADYLSKFSEKYLNFEYVIRRWDGTQLYQNNVYYSNKRGILGEFSDRSAYFNLLKESKVALYSTPGIDEKTVRFMNNVTPSLFEFLSAGCRIIARYPQNLDTIFFELEKLSLSTNSYEQFEKVLVKYLSDTSFSYLNFSAEYLQKHYTSNRANQLLLILKGKIN